METEATGVEFVKPCGTTATVKRPMNAFLIFCKRHRGLVHEKNPHLDNRSITRILGDLWANLATDDKSVYTNLAKEYKEAFLKANPNYKWYNPDKHGPASSLASKSLGSLVSTGVMSSSTCTMYSQKEGITPGKLADPSLMGGLSLLLMAGQHTTAGNIVNGGTLVDNVSLLTGGQQSTPLTQLKEVNMSRTQNELTSPLSPDTPGGMMLFPVAFSFPTSNNSTTKMPAAVPSSAAIHRNLSNVSDSPMDLSSRCAESGNLIQSDCLNEQISVSKSGHMVGVPPEKHNGVNHLQTGRAGPASNGLTAFSFSDATASSTSMLWFISSMLDSHLRTPTATSLQSLHAAQPPPVHGAVNSWIGNLPCGLPEDKKKLSPVSAAPALENIGHSSAEAGLGEFFPRTKKQLAAEHSKPCTHRVFPGSDSDGVKSAETSPSRSSEYLPSTVAGENSMPTLRSLTFAEIQEKLIAQVVGSGPLSSLLCDEHVTRHTAGNNTCVSQSGSRLASGDAAQTGAVPCRGSGRSDGFHSRKVSDHVANSRLTGGVLPTTGTPDKFERASATLTSTNHSTTTSSLSCHQQYRFPKVPLISQLDVHRLIERVISESDPAEFEPSSISNALSPVGNSPLSSAIDPQSESFGSSALSHLANSSCTREPLMEKLQVSCLNTATLPLAAPKMESRGKGPGGNVAKQCRDGKIRKRKKASSSAPSAKIPETLDIKLSNVDTPDNELFDQSVHNLMHFCTAAIATKPLNLLAPATSAETKCSIPSSDEINNNGSCRHDNSNDVSLPAVTANLSAASGTRKSNRCNRGRRYHELLSRGALHSARRQTSTSSVDCESQAGEVNSDFISDSKPDLMDIAEFSSIPTTVGGRCKRFKSGEFDLEAQIASLPACRIATSDRRPINRMRSRSHSQTCSKPCNNATADKVFSSDLRHHWMNICELRLLTKHIDLKQHSVALTNGTVSTSGAVPLLSGTCRRKPAKCNVMHLIYAGAAQSSDVSKLLITSSHSSGTTGTCIDADLGLRLYLASCDSRLESGLDQIDSAVALHTVVSVCCNVELSVLTLTAQSSSSSDIASSCVKPSSEVPSTVCSTTSSSSGSSTTVSLPSVLPLV